MAQPKSGDKVKVNYTGKLENGEVFDTSVGREPLEFTLGGKEIIPGFEQAVQSMDEGESKSITIASNDAYGPRNDQLMINVAKDQLPENFEPKVGAFLQVRIESGETMRVRIAEVGDTDVLLDGNHPLAGKDLTFEIELLEIVA